MRLQLQSLFNEFLLLQQEFGDPTLSPIYGAGQLNNPSLMLIFMNPTARNISCNINWKGIKAPWIGTKNIWKLLYGIDVIDKTHYDLTQKLRPKEWDEDIAYQLYASIAKRNVYITNYAKCTQIDARPLKNSVFKSYRKLLEEEIRQLGPKRIITFGNQVSENLLSKKISVSKYIDTEYEDLIIDSITYKVYPTYYPVGQGQRNMGLARDRILSIIRER